MEESITLNDYRCNCGKLLFKGALLACRLEIKCKKCGEIKTVICGDKNDCANDSYRLERCEFISEINNVGNFLSVGKKMADTLGYKPDEMIGKPILDFLSFEGSNAVRDIFLIFATEKQPFRIFKNYVKCKGGKLVLFETYFFPNSADNGTVGYNMASWPSGRDGTPKTCG